MSVNKTVHKGNCNNNKRKCYWTEDYEIESIYNNNIQTCFSEPFFTKGNKPTFITYSLGQKKTVYVMWYSSTEFSKEISQRTLCPPIQIAG